MIDPRAMPPRALLITQNYPPAIGGTSRLFRELYGRLGREEAQIAAGGTPAAAAQGERGPGGAEVVRLPLRFPDWTLFSVSGWRRYARARRALRRLLTVAAASQVHCARILPEGWLALDAAARRPIACWVHGEELATMRSSRQFRWMARRVVRGTRLFVANSGNTARRLGSDWQVPPERIRILRPAVDLTAFRPASRDAAARAALGWDARQVVLTVSRLQKRKGHDRMIEALPRILERHPRLLYAIVGDGEERGSLEAQARGAGLDGHVCFHGELDDRDLLRAYQQCDLFALPNREVEGDFEGFGMVLLEAQACGRAVIAGASGGTSEALLADETGLLVDCESAQLVADAVNGLLADAARREAMGRAGRRWVEQGFDWAHRVAELRRLCVALETVPAPMPER